MLQYLQNGYTSLHYAAENGHSEIVQLLLIAGATDSPDQVLHCIAGVLLFDKPDYLGLLIIAWSCPLETRIKCRSSG